MGKIVYLVTSFEISFVKVTTLTSRSIGRLTDYSSMKWAGKKRGKIRGEMVRSAD